MKRQKTRLFHQTNTNKRHCFIGLLFLLLWGTSANAQNINWTSGYPKIDSQPIVVLEDDRTLQIRFTPLAGKINNATIEAQLPPNVEYVSTSSPTAGITVSASAGGALGTGKLVTITVTSNGNSLIQNNEVEFFVKVNAKCGASGASNFEVRVKSGAGLVANGQKSLTANIVVPSLALTSSDGTINYPTQATVNTITYYLKTNTADKASSAKVVFTTDLNSTLSEFKLKGVSFTPTITTSGSSRLYTFAFTQTQLGSKIDHTNDKVITFRGRSSQCGSHVVSANVQFPHNSSCATATGSLVTMAFPSVTVPNMVHVSTDYVNASDGVIANTAINMNGTASTNVKTVYRNDGGSNAHEVVLQAYPYAQWAYIDLANIYVQVQGGSKRLVTSGEITIHAVRANSTNYAYYKSGYKPHNISINVPDLVPPGSTITYWIPTINGDIYSNGTNNVFHDYGANTINGFVTNIIRSKSPCGDAGLTAVVANRIAYLNAPHYRQLPSSMSFKGGQIRKQTIYVAPGSTSNIPSEFYIDIPAWLSIQSIKMTSNSDETGTVYLQTYITHGPTLHSVRYSGFSNLGGTYLHITYQANMCGGTTNTTGQIHYWVDYNWPHTLQKISQVFQDVTLECAVSGIALDEFKLVRTTKGLKDSNNDRIPDDGSVALDLEIRHDAYVDGDLGYFYWEGTVQAPGGYKYIDIPIKTTGFTLGTAATNVILTGGNTVSINGTPSSAITYTSVNSTTGYFRFPYPSGLANGAVVKIKVPFRANIGTNNYNNIETEFYVSNTAVSNPNNSASDLARFGKDKSSAQIGLYNFDRLNHWNKDSANELFTNNNIKSNFGLGYVDIFHSGRFSTPWFSREVRFHEYLEKLVWNLPKGYKVISPLTIRNESNVSQILAEDGSSTAQQKIYNVNNIYDLNFNGSGAPTPGKWQRPDDFWRLTLIGGIQATRAAKIGNSTMTRAAIWRKPGGTNTLSTLTVTFVYSGEGVVLDIMPKTIIAYGPTVKNPVLTMTNPNSYIMQDVYFYIDGNVKNVKLKDVGGGTTYTGVGLDGRWVKVSNFNVGDSKSFEMTYTYNGSSACTNDIVKVYTASGFNAAWSPDTAFPLDLTDDVHVGISDEFIIQTAPATISGSITSNKDTIPEASMGDYEIKASFSTLSSGGALKNPEMILTVPEGQVYQSAQIEYPVGTFNPVPLAMHSALNSALESGTEGTSRTVTLKLADAKGGDIIIPGNLDPIAVAADLTASIVIKMKAACNTDFLGIQYKGEISGKSACNAPAIGNGTKIVSPALYPNVSYNYIFDKIVTATTSGVRAFNEIQTQDTLLLTVKKIVGSVNNMLSTDNLFIQIPEELDLAGNSIHYEAAGAMSAIIGTHDVIQNNTTALGVRTLQFPMPIAAYNAAANKGVGENVTYKIPVKYLPNGQNRASNPVDSILSTIYAQAKFGNCPPVRVSVGDGKDSVALMTADSIPYIIYVGDTAALKIASTGFTGSWYLNKTSSTVLSSSNPWLYIPVDTFALGDTTFYFSSIVGGHDYGRLPYAVSVYIHPWFIQNLDTFKYICADKDSLIVRADGMDIKYQWYYNLTTPITGATDSFYVASVAGKYHVLVTDSVGEIISSDTMSLYLNEVPVFTKNLPPKAKECDKWGYTLKVETTGHHLLYQWYRDGVKIPGANSASHYALSQDSSAFFRVAVKTLCGDSIMSQQCYLSFCDESESVYINREVELIAPNTVKTDPLVGIYQVQSQSDFEFTINVQDGYSLKYINIVTDDPIWTDQGGIIKKMISENAMKVSILTVTKPLTVTVSGISAVSNQDIDSDLSKAWAYNGKIYVKTTEIETVSVFTTMGHLYKHEKVEEGITSFDAEPGVYFVKFNSGYTGKVFVK